MIGLSKPGTIKSRLLEGQAVTIAAGYLFNGGIILCADTQETVGVSKTQTPKLVLEPRGLEGTDSSDDLMIVMAGAGDGPLIDKLIERAWGDASVATSFKEACSLVQLSIEETYRHYLGLFHPGQMPYSDVVYGVKMLGESKLFRATGPIVNERTEHSSVGTGYYLADFIASRMYKKQLSGPQVAILAAYILFQCKEHVDGCGGDSHIAALYNTGLSKRLDPFDVHFFSEEVEHVDSVICELLLSAPDYSLADGDYAAKLTRIVDNLAEMRVKGREFRGKIDLLMAGLRKHLNSVDDETMPSTSQTLTDQQ